MSWTRRRLTAAGAIIVLMAAVAVGIAGLSDNDRLDAPLPAVPVVLGTLTAEPALPLAGQRVVARARIAADRALTLSGLTVRVQDSSGNSFDFPVLRGTALGTSEQEFVLERAFPAPGVYRFYLAYETASGWTSLPPWQTLTVR